MKKFFLMLGAVLLLSVNSVYAQKVNVNKARDFVRAYYYEFKDKHRSYDAFLDISFDEAVGTIHYCAGKCRANGDFYKDVVNASQDSEAKERVFTNQFFGGLKDSDMLDGILKTKANLVLSYYKDGCGSYLEVPYNHEEMKAFKKKWQDNYVEVKEVKHKKDTIHCVCYPAKSAQYTEEIKSFLKNLNRYSSHYGFKWSYNEELNLAKVQIQTNERYTVVGMMYGVSSFGWILLRDILEEGYKPSKFLVTLLLNRTGILLTVQGTYDEKPIEIPLDFKYLKSKAEDLMAADENYHEKRLLDILPSLNNGYPQDLNNGLCMEKVFMENRYLVYQCAVDESRLPLSTIAQLKDKLKVQMAGSLKKQFASPDFEKMGQSLDYAHFGIRYHYYVKGKTDCVDINYSNKEVRAILGKRTH